MTFLIWGVKKYNFQSSSGSNMNSHTNLKIHVFLSAYLSFWEISILSEQKSYRFQSSSGSNMNSHTNLKIHVFLSSIFHFERCQIWVIKKVIDSNLHSEPIWIFIRISKSMFFYFDPLNSFIVRTMSILIWGVKKYNFQSSSRININSHTNLKTRVFYHLIQFLSS